MGRKKKPFSEKKDYEEVQKLRMIQQIQEAGRAILKTGHNPVIRCEDRAAEEKMEAELALKAQKEEALGEAERRLEEYQRSLFGRA